MKNLTLMLTFLSTLGVAQVPSPTGAPLGQAGTFAFRYGIVIAMTDADYPLTYPQTAAGFIKFTGTLTATRNITGFPPCTSSTVNYEIGAENATNQTLMLASTIPVTTGMWGKATCDGSQYISTGGGGGGGSAITALTGDGTASGPGSATLVLTSVNANPGSYNLGGTLFNFNSKGLLTSVGAPFSFTMSCSASGTYEAGQTTSNPNTCTFSSYAGGTPASGTLVDSQSHTGSFASPWSSGTLAYSYCTVADGVSSQTFTGNVTATNSQSYSQQAGTTCLPREFGGVGTSGATGATASGTTAVLAGATGTLASAGLGQQSTWGPYSPSSQYIYILGTGSACTFTLGGFSFLMNSPISFSFTNQYGAAIGMYLYRSVNPQSGSVTLVGTC